MKPAVRVACAGDLYNLEDLDFACAPDMTVPYTQKEWAEILSDNKRLILGVDNNGFKSYCLIKPLKYSVEIVRFGTAVHYRRKGYCTMMIKFLQTWSSNRKCRTIQMIVPETELEAQLFLKYNGFICIKAIKSDVDNLLFIWRP